MRSKSIKRMFRTIETWIQVLFGAWKFELHWVHNREIISERISKRRHTDRIWCSLRRLHESGTTWFVFTRRRLRIDTWFGHVSPTFRSGWVTVRQLFSVADNRRIHQHLLLVSSVCHVARPISPQILSRSRYVLPNQNRLQYNFNRFLSITFIIVVGMTTYLMNLNTGKWWNNKTTCKQSAKKPTRSKKLG